MKHRFAALCSAILLLSFFVPQAPAQTAADKVAAEKSGEGIVNAFGTRKYKLVWDQMTSQWFKSRVTEEAFLANLSMGRAQLGAMQSTKLVSTDYATQDPSSGYQGSIYAMMFRSKYASTDIFERIVVIKDGDGNFRLSGFFATPAP